MRHAGMLSQLARRIPDAAELWHRLQNERVCIDSCPFGFNALARMPKTVSAWESSKESRSRQVTEAWSLRIPAPGHPSVSSMRLLRTWNMRSASRLFPQVLLLTSGRESSGAGACFQCRMPKRMTLRFLRAPHFVCHEWHLIKPERRRSNLVVWVL